MKKLQLLIIGALFLTVQLVGNNSNAQCTLPTIPSSVMTTGGLNKVCPGETRTYTTALVANVTYTWTPPTGGDIISGQGTNSIAITYNAGFIASGYLSVSKVNGCGSGPARTISIMRNLPSTPAPFTGNLLGMCDSTNVVYTTNNVIDVTYNWTVPYGLTITGGQGTNSITVDYASNISVATYISVTANNACGSSMIRKMMTRTGPGTPSTIYGNTTVCPGSSGNAYSIDPVFAATYYIWTGPKYSILTDGVTTSTNNIFTTTATAVTVNYGNVVTGNKLTAKAYNNCGYGIAKSIYLTASCVPRLVNNDNEKVTFTPNPATNEFSVSGLQFNVGDAIKIYDTIGNIVYQAAGDEQKSTVNVSKFKNGVYFVQIASSDKTITQKLIVQH